jgi:hypothetical protein
VTCTWDIHGVRVRFDSELGVPPALDHGLRHHLCDDSGATHIHVRVRSGAASVAPEGGVPIRFHRLLPVTGVVSETHFWLRAGAGSVDGDLGTGRVEVTGPDAAWLQAPTVVRTLLPLGLMLQLARRGLFHIHAAVVVDPEGDGWMLVGGGGVGKSTTTWRLLERGWSYLCDDGGLLTRDGRVVALSFWDELQLDLDMAERLGGVEWDEAPSGTPTKGVVATDRLFPGRRVERADISRLVILRRAGSGVEPACRIAALAALLDDNRLSLVSSTAAHFDLLARLVGQCRVGWMHAGERALAQPESALAEAVAGGTGGMASMSVRG